MRIYAGLKSRFGRKAFYLLVFTAALFFAAGFLPVETHATPVVPDMLDYLKSFFSGQVSSMQGKQDMYSMPFSKNTSSLLNEFAGQMSNNTANVFSLPEDVLSGKAGIYEKYSDMKQVSNTLFAIAVVFVVSAIAQSADENSSRKLKKLLLDIFAAALMLNLFEYAVPRIIHGSNLFLEYFMPAEMLTPKMLCCLFFFGATTFTQSIIMLFLGVFLVIGLLLLFLLISLVIYKAFLMILVVLFPVVISAYPTDFGKKLLMRWLSFFGFILVVGPLEALSLNLAYALFMNGGGGLLQNLIMSVAMLLMTAFCIPALVFFLFSMASQPKTSII